MQRIQITRYRRTRGYSFHHDVADGALTMNAWLVSTLILSLAWAWPAEAARYTLGQLVEKVTRESPSIVAARAAVAVRQAQVLEQQLRWLPDGEAGATLYGAPAVRYDVPDSTATTDIVDLTRSVPDKSLFDRAPIHAVRITLGADLRQPLYTFGKIAAAIGSARGGLAYDSGNLTRDELDVGLTAVRIYTQIRVARIALDSVEQTLQQMRDWEKQIDVALDGKNPLRFGETDLARMRLSIVNTEIAKLDYERNFVAAREALRQLTNDPSADTDEADFAYTGSSQEAEVARDIARRPEVLASRAGLDYYGKWHHLHLSFALPDVGFVSSAWGGYVPNTDPNNPQVWTLAGGYVGLVLREPLDFGPKLMRWMQIGHEERMQRARFAMGYGYWQLELLKARLDFREAYTRLAKTQKAEGVTHGWYAAVHSNLALGLATDGRELVDVMMSWCGYRVQHAQAVADTLIALATLQRMSGEPILGALR